MGAENRAALLDRYDAMLEGSEEHEHELEEVCSLLPPRHIYLSRAEQYLYLPNISVMLFTITSYNVSCKSQPQHSNAYCLNVLFTSALVLSAGWCPPQSHFFSSSGCTSQYMQSNSSVSI